MHFFRLLHRREPPATRAEPKAFTAGHALARTGTGMPQTDSDPLAMFDEAQLEEDQRGSAAIFGLLGSRPVLEDGATSRTSVRVDGEDLIASLHRQYCQALDNPFGPAPAADWESPAEPSGRYVHSESGLPVDPHLYHAGHDSIEALLSGAQLLDHAFGPLRESDLGSRNPNQCRRSCASLPHPNIWFQRFVRWQRCRLRSRVASTIHSVLTVRYPCRK